MTYIFLTSIAVCDLHYVKTWCCLVCLGSLHGPLCLFQSVCYCFFLFCLPVSACSSSVFMAATTLHRYYCNLLKMVLFYNKSSVIHWLIDSYLIWQPFLVAISKTQLMYKSCQLTLKYVLNIDLTFAFQCREVLWNKTTLQRNVALMSLKLIVLLIRSLW